MEMVIDHRKEFTLKKCFGLFFKKSILVWLHSHLHSIIIDSTNQNFSLLI